MKYQDCVRALVVSAAVATICLGSGTTFAQSSQSEAVQSGPGSMIGMWRHAGYKNSGRYPVRERVLLTVDGKMPPLLPWAKELLEKRITDSEKGNPFSNTLTECLPGGVPLMTFGATYPVQILETPGQITMLFEELNHYRVIYLNGKHPDDPDPAFMGHSIGHWEGGALVVDTVGLTERTTLDQVGMPHSDQLRVIERYRRTDKDTMEVLVTIDDPKTFEKPWDAKTIYKLAPPDTRLIEYICENNRNTPDAQGRTGFDVPTKNP